MRFLPADKLTAYREALGGRRFLITLGCGVVNTILVALKLIDNSTYQTIILGTVAVYIAGHAYVTGKGGENVRTTDSKSE